MPDVYLISSPQPVRTNAVFSREAHAAMSVGGRALSRLSHGTLVELNPAKVAGLEAHGYQVVHYEDTDRLRIAGRDIDIIDPTKGLRGDELVPADRAQTWPLHVVQFRGPAFPEWRAALEKRGLEIVGRAGRYGVMIHATPDEAAELKQLRFISMLSPLQPAWKLDPRLVAAEPEEGRVSLRIFPENSVDAVAEAAKKAGGTMIKEVVARHGARRLLVSINLANAGTLATHPNVFNVSLQPLHETHGERQVQILAENLDTTPTPNTNPVTGYDTFLSNLDADGTGVTVAIADTGIDQGANNNTSGHLDLRGRQVGYTRYTVGTNTPPTTDTNGHGTHVAGIAVGDDTTNTAEAAPPNDFLWGHGVAPGAQYFGQAMQNAGGSGVYVPPIPTLCSDAVNQGASVQNNSWGSAGTTAYTQDEEDFDAAVRDADGSTAAFESLCVVFSAGNMGGDASTIGEPGSAKNVITVGNGLNRRPGTRFPDDDIRGLNGSSSRGPALGGRNKPDVIAPGTDISSTMSQTAGETAVNSGGGATYTYKSGTSMSAPAVTGACAVLTEWWRDRTGGDSPSPAMLKALLVNGAEDMVGGSNWRAVALDLVDAAQNIYRATGMGFTPTQVSVANVLLTQVGSATGMSNLQWSFAAGTLTCRIGLVGDPTPVGFHCLATPLTNIPNNDQGWGRVSLENIVYKSPTSDRGPKLFLDQRTAFTANNQHHTWRIQPADTSRPMRITLVYTDAPGQAGDNTPWVNNLNLRLQRTIGGTTTTWRGNTNFVNGFSTPGGAADMVNNVECVYIQSPAGVYDLAVIAQTLTADARDSSAAGVWQDYALVVDNAVYAAADPVAVSLVLDRSGSMQTSSYVDVTRMASKLFVDLMTADDEVGVVSFGSTAKHEYHSGDEVVTITGLAQKDAAKTAIDTINFGGCTYMGQGLEFAEAQLASTSNTRAVVLLSDGKDNKGCDLNNPGKAWAKDVAAAMPSNIDVYTCAMGPLSDQETLEDIADLTGGKYYYMPAIDDLYEIYNFIRGNVTSTGVIVNTTSTASSSRTPAIVDCGAESVVLACQWHDPNLTWTGLAPGANEIRVRLRTPSGQLLDPETTWVHRQEDKGHVIFSIEDPQPGRWQVEVETSRRQHTRYTVGGWVRSDIQLDWKLAGRLGSGLSASVGLRAGKGLRVSYSAIVTAPVASLKDLLRQHWDRLDGIRADPTLVDAGISPDLARLFAFDRKLVAGGGRSLFTPKTTRVRLSTLPRVIEPAVPELVGPSGRLRPVMPVDLSRRSPTLIPRAFPTTARIDPGSLGHLRPVRPQPAGPLTHGLRVPVKIAGSYTLRLHAKMVNPSTKCRFERVAAESVYIGRG